MKKTGLLILVALLCSPAAASAGSDPETSNTYESASKIFTMNQVFRSMFGPKDIDRFMLSNTSAPEVLWITAIRADMVAADGETPESPEYFCHSVLTRVNNGRPIERLKGLGLSTQRTKLFTLFQGHDEIRFPKGFGMPVFSNDRFSHNVMVMNPTERDEPVHVGVDSRIEYFRESELSRAMKPLFLVPLVTMVPVEGDHADHTTHQHGDGGDETCLEGDIDSTAAKRVDDTDYANSVSANESGVEETGHWYVPPGRHVYRYRLGQLDDRIHLDTRVHYIVAHLHPFGESLELIDLTTGESVFKASANNFSDRMAVEEITSFSSQEGLVIQRHHDYEIVAVYNNTTSQDVDSMAVMYLYLHDSLRSAGAKLGGM